MKKLSILLSTINDRIYAAEPLLQNRFEDTEFVVVHQITNLSKTDTYSNLYNKFDSAYVRFVPMFDKGTGKSRNLAMQKAEGELMYLCDDDLVFASKIEAMLLQISKKADDKNEYRSFF